MPRWGESLTAEPKQDIGKLLLLPCGRGSWCWELYSRRNWFTDKRMRSMKPDSVSTSGSGDWRAAFGGAIPLQCCPTEGVRHPVLAWWPSPSCSSAEMRLRSCSWDTIRRRENSSCAARARLSWLMRRWHPQHPKARNQRQHTGTKPSRLPIMRQNNDGQRGIGFTPNAIVVRSLDLKLVTSGLHGREKGAPSSARIDPFGIESLQSISEPQLLGSGQTERGEADFDPMSAGWNRDRAGVFHRFHVVDHDLFDRHRRWNGIALQSGGIHDRDTGGHGKPEPAIASLASHRLRAARAFRRGESVALGIADGVTESARPSAKSFNSFLKAR